MGDVPTIGSEKQVIARVPGKSVLPHGYASLLIGVGAIVLLAASATAQPSPPVESIRAKSEDIFSRPEFKRRESDRDDAKSRSEGSTSRSQKESSAPSRRESNTQSEGSSSSSRSSSSTPSTGAMLPGSCFTVLLIIIAVVFLIVIVMFFLKNRSKIEEPEVVTQIPEKAAEEIVGQRAWLSENYRAQAEYLAETGDYIEAIRFLFLALVYRFDESGKVSFHKEYTNREYLDLLDDRRNVRDLKRIVDILDDHWYGQQPCGRKEYEDCLRVYERLVE
jgi:hypothetical protein